MRQAARLALFVLFGAVLAGCANPGFSGHENVARYLAPAAKAKLPARKDSYLGVYEPGVPRNYHLVGRFSAEIKKTPNLLLYYSSWGESFDLSFANKALQHGAVPVIQMDPGKVSLSSIAKGKHDFYLRAFASQVRSFGRPVVMGFAREMNGGWYPWGEKHVRPRVWIAAWRHIVTLFRRSGARNVTWQWTVNDESPGTLSPGAWWPGGAYVDWVGIDGYYYTKADNFGNVFGSTIVDVRKITHKPIVISEVAMSPQADPVAQLPLLFASLRQRHLLGMVWFDAPARRDWRLENNPSALRKFRHLVHKIASRSQ